MSETHSSLLKPAYPEWARYLPVISAPLILFAPLLLTGKVLFWGTPALQFVPWWWQAWQQVQAGVLPLWNPLNGMGAPLLANYQMAFFYPPNGLLLVCAALSGPAGIAVGYTVLTVLHLSWAGLGMALLLRQLGHSWLAQMIGGIAFGLSGYLVGRVGFFSMIWTAAWLPWLIFWLERDIIRAARLKWSLGLGASMGMLLLAGHAQLAWYSLILAGGWLLWRGRQSFWRKLGSFAFAGIAGVGLAAVQLIPTAEYLLNSQRASAVGYADTMTYSFWPWRLITLLSPDFFGNPGHADFWGYASYWEDHAYLGVMALLLALLTLGMLLRRKGEGKANILMLWGLILVSVLLALGQNTPIFPFLYRSVPTFSMFQAPARYLIWLTFALCLLAAIGADAWHTPTGRGLYWLRLGTAGAFAVTLGAGLTSLAVKGVRMTFIQSVALTGFWALGVGALTLTRAGMAKRGGQAVWSAAALVWCIADLCVAGWSLLPGVSPDFYTPQAQVTAQVQAATGTGRLYIAPNVEYDLKFNRFLRFQDFNPHEDWKNLPATLLPNTNLLMDVASANNFDPLIPERFGLWMDALQKQPAQAQKRWLALMDVGAVETIDPFAPLGVRFDSLPDGLRWRVLNCSARAGDAKEALSLWAAAAQEGAQSALILEGAAEADCLPGQKAAQPVASIQVDWQRADGYQVSVQTTQSAWFFAAETWYPGWQVMVDGAPAQRLPANEAFWAVKLPAAGLHKVSVNYRPLGFAFWLILSILTVLICIFLQGKLSTRK